MPGSCHYAKTILSCLKLNIETLNLILVITVAWVTDSPPHLSQQYDVQYTSF